MKKLFIAMIALSLACGSSEDAPTEAELDEEAAQAAAELEAAVEEVSEEAAVAEAGVNAEEAVAAAGSQGSLVQAAAALQEAMAAVEAGEGSTCERAYASGRAMAEQFNNGVLPENFPEESAFVSACDELPEQEQQCLTPSYAMQNQAVCQTALQSEAMTQFRVSIQAQ